jgi:hypothetical protein
MYSGKDRRCLDSGSPLPLCRTCVGAYAKLTHRWERERGTKTRSIKYAEQPRFKYNVSRNHLRFRNNAARNESDAMLACSGLVHPRMHPERYCYSKSAATC